MQHNSDGSEEMGFDNLCAEFLCTPPVAACQNITIYLDECGTTSITTSDVNNGSTFDCGLDSMSIDQTLFTLSDTGANTISLIVVDINGASDTCMAIVTVLDTIAPTLTCSNDSNTKQ